MTSRFKLHEELCGLLLTRNVYFQPPESIKMKYPCIVYSRTGIDQRYANNMIYKDKCKYSITVIDTDPDSDIPDKIRKYFPMCSFDRSFVSDNLNHTVLTLYY